MLCGQMSANIWRKVAFDALVRAGSEKVSNGVEQSGQLRPPTACTLILSLYRLS